jgi:large subunit ribosomal protein L10
MGNVGRLINSFCQQYIEKNLEEVDCIFLVKYSEVNAPQLSLFRNILKAHLAHFTVIKNSIAKRVFKSKGLETLFPILEGPCGIVWVKGDPVAVAKAIFNFSKENEGLKIKGGLLKNKVISSQEVSQLATLPNREVLYAQLSQLLKTPLLLLVLTLREVPRRLVYVLNIIKEKSKGGENGRKQN